MGSVPAIGPGREKYHGLIPAVRGQKRHPRFLMFGYRNFRRSVPASTVSPEPRNTKSLGSGTVVVSVN